MFNLLRSKPDLIVHSRTPYNGEPPLPRLRAAFLTPQADFYVRSHGDVPRLAGEDHRLRVEGRVATALNVSVAELRNRFRHHTITAVMQCAGNRRADLHKVRAVTGDPWAPGAIGNAAWTGVALGDVLRAAGAGASAELHVAFTAEDEVKMPGECRCKYGVSIPIAKAMSPEVLLAFEMNGEPLRPEHGFPLRVVVPGYAGVRSPKWLSRICVQDTPSDNHMQQRDYKLLPPHMTEKTVDWAKGITIYDMPLNSAICEPAPQAVLKAGATLLRGYAIATARDVVRVDVSIDGGRSWTQAQLDEGAASPWSWTFWQARVDLPKGAHELVVRAWDGAGQTQPALPNDVWNFKGYMCASWHRVPVSVV